MRQILNKDQAKVEQAKALLEKDDSPANWKKVAAKYSTDTATKDSGGLRSGVAKGQSDPALEEQIFSAPQGQLVGPFKGQAGYYLIEVEKITPASDDAAVEGQRADQAAARSGQAAGDRARTSSRTSSTSGRSRTFCADGYVIDRCENFTATPQSTPGAPPVTSTPAVLPGHATVFPGQPAPALPQGPIQPPSAAAQPGVIGPGGQLPPGSRAAGRRRPRRRPARSPVDSDALDALARLDEITRRLRRECPWDREQDERSIVPHTVEEAYELADAAASGDDAKLVDELGDVLFQVHFLALLLEERGAGGLAEVAEGTIQKLIRRHPHVFGEAEARDCGRGAARTGTRSSVTRREGGRASRSPTCPRTCPPCSMRARSSAGRRPPASREPSPHDRIEDPELRDAAEAWLGDALFALVDVARRLRVDPELALRAATHRFRDQLESD